MDQAPNYFNFMPTQFGPAAPPPFMDEQFQQQQHHGDYSFYEQHPPVDQFMDAVNAEVWAAVQAVRSMDARSLHLAYANLGFVLGIDKACTYFVQSYSSANPADDGSRRTAKLFFKKDWENLEAMVADIDNEKKIVHVEQFMRRRRIPGYVTLHAPKQFVWKSVEKLVMKQEKIISPVDATCQVRDEVMRLDVACQTQDESVISLNVACQTENFRGLEAGCQTERYMSLEVACQTVEKSAGLSVSCQTMSRKSADKIVRKDSDNRKRARGDEQDSRSDKRSASNSKSLDSKDDARMKVSSQNGSGSRKRPRDDEVETLAASGQRPILNARIRRTLRRAELKKKSTIVVDDEKSSRNSNDKIIRKDSSDNCKHARDGKSETRRIDRSVSHSKRSDSKSDASKSSALKSVSCRTTNAVDGKKSSRDSVVTSSGKVRDDSKHGTGVAETKRSTPRCKENAQNLESYCCVTKLVIQNLHPLVDEADISAIFSDFKSYKSCKMNFYNYGKLCAADVVFEEEADAVEAKNQFDGKNLDGFPMHIVVVKSEKNEC